MEMFFPNISFAFPHFYFFFIGYLGRSVHMSLFTIFNFSRQICFLLWIDVNYPMQKYYFKTRNANEIQEKEKKTLLGRLNICSRVYSLGGAGALRQDLGFNSPYGHFYIHLKKYFYYDSFTNYNYCVELKNIYLFWSNFTKIHLNKYDVNF